jgi:hypothetical protein
MAEIGMGRDWLHLAALLTLSLHRIGLAVLLLHFPPALVTQEALLASMR